MKKTDLIAGAGLLLICGGTWWIYPPLALIVAGSAVLTAAIALARTETVDVHTK